MDYYNCSTANSSVFVPTQEMGTKEQQDKLKCEKAFVREKKVFGDLQFDNHVYV